MWDSESHTTFHQMDIFIAFRDKIELASNHSIDVIIKINFKHFEKFLLYIIYRILQMSILQSYSIIVQFVKWYYLHGW